MTGRSDETDDAAWRAIVENYGDRPTLDATGPPTAAGAVPEPRDRFDDPDESLDEDPDHDLDEDPDEEPADRFVPPEPPPLPSPPPARLAAWTGLFGSPAVLLVCLLLGIGLPSLAAYALIAAFVGGFGYLVVHMDPEPRDPWDDGAQV